MPDWTDYPIQDVPLDRIVFPCHDINPAHVHEIQPDSETGPIHVEELLDGSLFCHNGRHRVLRARLAGHDTVEAIVARRGRVRLAAGEYVIPGITLRGDLSRYLQAMRSASEH